MVVGWKNVLSASLRSNNLRTGLLSIQSFRGYLFLRLTFKGGSMHCADEGEIRGRIDRINTLSNDSFSFEIRDDDLVWIRRQGRHIFSGNILTIRYFLMGIQEMVA